MGPRLRPGAIVVFDDFLAHETWEEDEKRAWDECVAARGIDAEILAASLLSKQVVFRVCGVKET